MKVIVAGYPKTGTKSMDAALTILGYKVYGHIENISLLEKEWTKMLRDGGSTEDFRKMYENVDAVSDVPACVFWEEILAAFPDAKIILMRRESEEEWFKSLVNHMQVFQTNFMIRMLKTTSPTQWRIERNVSSPTARLALGYSAPHAWANTVKVNEQLAKKRYRAHNAHVMQNAPKDQLLLYNVSEGWDPLCKFLGVAVPDRVFPHKNVRGNIHKEWFDQDRLLLKMQQEMRITLSVVAVLISLGVYGIITHPPVVFQSAFSWFKDAVTGIFSFLN